MVEKVWLKPQDKRLPRTNDARIKRIAETRAEEYGGDLNAIVAALRETEVQRLIGIHKAFIADANKNLTRHHQALRKLMGVQSDQVNQG